MDKQTSHRLAIALERYVLAEREIDRDVKEKRERYFMWVLRIW